MGATSSEHEHTWAVTEDLGDSSGAIEGKCNTALQILVLHWKIEEACFSNATHKGLVVMKLYDSCEKYFGLI